MRISRVSRIVERKATNICVYSKYRECDMTLHASKIQSTVTLREWGTSKKGNPN